MNPLHRSHDELLIARLTAGDVDARARADAERQLRDCGECRLLLADLQAIRSLTDRATLRVPPRPRSFRLTPDQLERAGRAAPWPGWLIGFGEARFDLVRPLATAVASIGLAVVVIGSFSPGGGAPAFLAPIGGAPASERAVASPAPVAAPAGGATPTAAVAPPLDRYGRPVASVAPTQGGSSSTPAAGEHGGRGTAGEASGGGPPSIPLVPAGLAILAGGAAVVALNTAARRAVGR